MKTKHKILALAAGLAAAGTVLAAVAVRLDPASLRGATIVAEAAVGTAFAAGLVAAFARPAAAGIEADRETVGPESELLRLKQE